MWLIHTDHTVSRCVTLCCVVNTHRSHRVTLRYFVLCGYYIQITPCHAALLCVVWLIHTDHTVSRCVTLCCVVNTHRSHRVTLRYFVLCGYYTQITPCHAALLCVVWLIHTDHTVSRCVTLCCVVNTHRSHRVTLHYFVLCG